MSIYRENPNNECWHQVNKGEECGFCKAAQKHSDISKIEQLQNRLAELQKQQQEEYERDYWERWRHITATT